MVALPYATTTRTPLTSSPSLMSTPRLWTTPFCSTRTMRKCDELAIWKVVAPAARPDIVKPPSGLIIDHAEDPVPSRWPELANNVSRRSALRAFLSSVPSITTTPESVAPFFVWTTSPVASSSTISNGTSSARHLLVDKDIDLTCTAYFPGTRFPSLNSPRLFETAPVDMDEVLYGEMKRFTPYATPANGWPVSPSTIRPLAEYVDRPGPTVMSMLAASPPSLTSM